MRIAIVLLAVLLLLAAGCGSKEHQSGLFSSTVSRGASPGGSQAGGAASLVVHGTAVTGKGLLVVRAKGDDIVVRNPSGGTLTVTRRHPAGAKAVARAGERVSFTGTRSGATVVAKTLSISGR